MRIQIDTTLNNLYNNNDTPRGERCCVGRLLLRGWFVGAPVILLERASAVQLLLFENWVVRRCERLASASQVAN